MPAAARAEARSKASDPLASLIDAHDQVQPVAASERVADAVRALIIDGELRAGVRLTEATVAARLGVSRNTVREALLLLIDERLAVREANRGVFVVTPDRVMVVDLYRMRALVESAAIMWGEDYDADACAPLRAVVEDARRARAEGDWDEVAALNLQFHRLIAGFSGSERVMTAFETTVAEMRLVFHATGTPRFHDAFVDENAELCELLESGRREEAAAYVRAYLARARDEVLALLG